jgi:magnesium chelatase subunit I
VASANPEDYTSRGRIITPLKDRYGAQIRTHYPVSIDDEMRVMDQERRHFQGDELEVFVPRYMKEIVAEITHLARRSADINQRSGVSVRVSIANYETLMSNAVRRAVTLGEKLAVPRITDLPFLVASTTGKIELESFEDTREDKILDDLTRKAVQAVFSRHFQVPRLEELVLAFNSGLNVEISETMAARSYIRSLKEITGLAAAVRTLDDSERPETVASAIEFILEGLHVNKRLNKVRVQGRTVYKR